MTNRNSNSPRFPTSMLVWGATVVTYGTDSNKVESNAPTATNGANDWAWAFGVEVEAGPAYSCK